jgi:hypothetical protein
MGKITKEEKAFLGFAGGMILLWLCAVCTIGFVVIHFVIKFW